MAQRDAAFFAERFTTSWEAVIVAVDQETPVGFLLMLDGHIDMLFMDPDFKRQGRGRAASRLCGKAWREKPRMLSRQSRRAPFYERHGWQVERAYEREFAGKDRNFVFYVKDVKAS